MYWLSICTVLVTLCVPRPCTVVVTPFMFTTFTIHCACLCTCSSHIAALNVPIWLIIAVHVLVTLCVPRPCTVFNWSHKCSMYWLSICTVLVTLCVPRPCTVLSHLVSALELKLSYGDGVTCVDLKVLNVPDDVWSKAPCCCKKYPAVAGYLIKMEQSST
jgi:hypothetical protein